MSFTSAPQQSRTDAAITKLSRVYRSANTDMTGMLLARFRSRFNVLPADTFERVRTALRIRYQVYCIENPHEAADHPLGLELDDFDSHAAQSLLIYRPTNAALGTVRLVLPLRDDLQRSFPMQRVMAREALDALNRIPLKSTGEVSRFSVSRDLRKANVSTAGEDAPSDVSSALLIRLGLMQALIRMSRMHGITHWCAAVEPAFQRMFAAMAIRFHPVGPLVDYHGLRQPCYGAIEDVLKAVKRERPAFWSVLTDGGALSDASSKVAEPNEFKFSVAC